MFRPQKVYGTDMFIGMNKGARISRLCILMAGDSHVTVHKYGLTYDPKLILELSGSSLDNPSLSVLIEVPPHDTP
jgi:hypothetical protein